MGSIATAPKRRARRTQTAVPLLEMHYTPDQLAVALGAHKNSILSWINEGLFGDDVLRKGENFVRVPASGVNKFVLEHRAGLPTSTEAAE